MSRNLTNRVTAVESFLGPMNCIKANVKIRKTSLTLFLFQLGFTLVAFQRQTIINSILSLNRLKEIPYYILYLVVCSIQIFNNLSSLSPHNVPDIHC